MRSRGKYLLAIATIIIVLVATQYKELLPPQKLYTFESSDGEPTIEQIVSSTGKELHPQIVSGTIPQLSWFVALEKLGLSKYSNNVPNWLNVDLSPIYDIFLKYNQYQPTGGILLYKYNFTQLDDADSLKEYIKDLDRYSTKLRLKNSLSGNVYEVEIKPFTFSDCVPNNIPKHYCRLFSNENLTKNYPKPTSINHAIDQYSTVSATYKDLHITSPLGPSVDISASNEWSIDQIEEYAKGVSIGMHKMGIIPTLKHWGYNQNLGDAHLGNYRDTRTIQELKSQDFRPYYAVNELGKPFFIMTTHFVMTAIDPDNVVTRSQKAVNYISEHFPNALVMTDEVSMNGFSQSESFEERISSAKGDMILVHSGLGLDIWSRRSKIYNGVISRNDTGIKNSISKILRLKQKMGLITINQVASEND